MMDHEKYHLLGTGLHTLVNQPEFSVVSEGEFIMAYLHSGQLGNVSTARIGNLGTRGTRNWYGIEGR
jgi:hypothetical protein